MKINLMATTLNVSVWECPRCKCPHGGLIATPFEDYLVGGYSHFTTCPTRNQPILFRLLGEKDELFGRVVEKLSR